MVDLFGEKAKDWDQDDFKTRLSRGISTAMLSHIDFTTDMDIMDFGAGTGLISGHLAANVAHISAVDVSQAMLDRLAAKPELQGKVEVVCHDIMATPLARKFDVIVSAMAMHHVDDTDKLIENFTTHLKDGGQIALADLDKEDGTFHPAGTEGVYHAGFQRDELEQLLNKHGVSNVRFTTAYTVERSGKAFPIFLVLGQKN
jgi:2-polyprenyl-3-methyl-5-hydroxy-6-metoxy-1,4-benzoquinol methylase